SLHWAVAATPGAPTWPGPPPTDKGTWEHANRSSMKCCFGPACRRRTNPDTLPMAPGPTRETWFDAGGVVHALPSVPP
ncbi:hypothetical protein JMJ77_0011282, partial [Colletotrichum scovillei]